MHDTNFNHSGFANPPDANVAVRNLQIPIICWECYQMKDNWSHDLKTGLFTSSFAKAPELSHIAGAGATYKYLFNIFSRSGRGVVSNIDFEIVR